MPHLNELIAHFEGRPIRFIAPTYETPEKARPVLQRVPMSAEVISVSEDVFRSVYDTSATGIPLTVIIDADGNIAKVTRPMGLTADYLEQFVKQAELGETSDPADVEEIAVQ